MTPFITAGAGFLLAVLWFDLMHDVQVLRHRHGDAPEEALAIFDEALVFARGGIRALQAQPSPRVE